MDAVAGSVLTAQVTAGALTPSPDVLDPAGQAGPLKGHLSGSAGRAMLKGLALEVTGRYVVRVVAAEGG
jgi:hypothetical protein